MSEHDSEEFSEAESESSENDSFPVPPPPSTQIPTPTQNTNTYNGNFGSPDPIPPPPMHPPIQDEEIVAKKLKMKLPPSLEKAKWVPPRHRGGERAKRASLDEDENTRDESREMTTYIMATST